MDRILLIFCEMVWKFMCLGINLVVLNKVDIFVVNLFKLIMIIVLCFEVCVN